MVLVKSNCSHTDSLPATNISDSRHKESRRVADDRRLGANGESSGGPRDLVRCQVVGLHLGNSSQVAHHCVAVDHLAVRRPTHGDPALGTSTAGKGLQSGVQSGAVNAPVQLKSEGAQGGKVHEIDYLATAVKSEMCTKHEQMETFADV